MTISIDLNGGASGSDATTAFTEQSIVSLFSSAALSANGGDSNSIDTVTLTLASATGMACTRFRGHRVRCHSGAGGGLWNANAMHENSSLRL